MGKDAVICFHIIVDETTAKFIDEELSDLKGIDRIEYSNMEELKKDLEEKILKKYEIKKEFKEFWLPFINEGGKIVVGTQTKNLKRGIQRNVFGKDDNIASSEFLSFLMSVAKPSIVKTQQIKVEHVPMPVIGNIKNYEISEEYLSSINDLFGVN